MPVNKYVKVNGREHVLLRPDTYIGTVRYSEVTRFVANKIDVTASKTSEKTVEKNDPMVENDIVDIVQQTQATTIVEDEFISTSITDATNSDTTPSTAPSTPPFEEDMVVDSGPPVKKKTGSKNVVVVQPTIEIVEDTVSFCPGLVQCFLEILNNARDRTVVTDVEVRCNRIEVTINEVTGELSVFNNGDSIPVEMHTTERIYNPELIFGHLLTSSNYDDSQRRIVGGRNGFGAKLTNIYSSTFSIELVDHKNKLKYSQAWSNNMESVTPPLIEKVNQKSPKPYTKITWTFDAKRFGRTTVVDPDFVRIVRKAVVDVAATVGTKVSVFFQGEEITCDTLNKYMDIYPHIQDSEMKFSAACNDRWKVAIASTPHASDGGVISFVNGMWTSAGGTHESHVVNQVVDVVVNVFKSRYKGDDKALIEGARNLPGLIRQRMWIFVDACIENPEFTSQTKECLKSPQREWGSECVFPSVFIKKIQNLDIYEHIMDSLRGKSIASLEKKNGRKKSTILGIEKYDPASWAGTSHSKKCLLIITEGDSAKATAVSGLKARKDRERFGIWPLRGKPINVRSASVTDLKKNEEFNNLKLILNLSHKMTYETEAELKTLRYGGLIVFTDQDTDGFHIKALVMNIFATFWPHLLFKGFIHALPTPIVKATKGKQVLPFYSIPQLRLWESTLPHGRTDGWDVKYYKGLGTSTAQEAKEYFSTFRTTQYIAKENVGNTIPAMFGKQTAQQQRLSGGEVESAGVAAAVGSAEDVITTEQLMMKIFDKEESDYRKEWIRLCNKEACIDPTKGKITIDEFIHQEYVQHANDNLERTTPGVIDGLKPSQRKIIFGCFQAGLHVGKKEMKVAQLGASVAEKTEYHHGEVSLMSAIINMAQTYTGSNNINLLEPIGMFGTRMIGGKDAASPRYLFTRLSKAALHLFRKEDNDILEYVVEEGKSVEPTSYIPIVPLVIINGSEGIGTGYSTKLPPSNPRDVIENVKRMIQSTTSIPFTLFSRYMPWWKNFKGTVRELSEGKYEIEGKYTYVSENVIRITELPIGTWTSPYKTFLDDLVTKEKIVRHVLVPDDEAVDITITLNPGPERLSDIDAQIESIEERQGAVTLATRKRKAKELQTAALPQITDLFKLKSRIATTNIHLYTSPYPRATKQSHIEKYPNVSSIYQDFFETRRTAYIARKQFRLDELEKEFRIASARVIFLTAKLDGTLIIEDRPLEDICSDMKTIHHLPTAEDIGRGMKSEGFDYLLDMKMSSMSREKVQHYKTECDTISQNIVLLRETTIESIWLQELTELERVLFA